MQAIFSQLRWREGIAPSVGNEGTPMRPSARRIVVRSFAILAAVSACVGTAPASAAVTHVTQWGSLGAGDGQFGGPVDLAATRTGTVFVADVFDNQAPRVQAFS